MRILYVWDSDYPWDVRVEKICASLQAVGHAVHVAARNLKTQQTYELVDGLHIHRFPIWKNAKINNALSFPAFFNPLWRRFLDVLISLEKINLLIVRDLPMAMAGIWAGMRHDIPVVFDMAEDYVAMLRDVWRQRKYQGFNLIVRNPFLAKLVERRVLIKADHILVVVEEARQLLLKYGCNPEKISIVGNTPLLEAFEKPLGPSDEVQEKISGHFAGIYVGGIQKGRGIQTVIAATSRIVEQNPDFLFVVVGDGYARQKLMRQAAMAGVQDHIVWAGWVDHDRVYDYIRRSKIGIIPHLVTEHVNTTMPNKIFDFMGAGLPVVASSSTPMERLLTRERCGVIFKNADPESFAEAFQMARLEAAELGKAGACAVQARHNWRRDEKRLAEAIKRVSAMR